MSPFLTKFLLWHRTSKVDCCTTGNPHPQHQETPYFVLTFYLLLADPKTDTDTKMDVDFPSEKEDPENTYSWASLYPCIIILI